LLEIYNPSDYSKLEQVVLARKGLNKFFDLKLEYISKEGRYREDRLSEYESSVKNLTLAAAKRAILEGHKVEIVKTLKANGENCQVSWCPEAEAWVVASKNVGILVSEAADLELYPAKNLRYTFSGLMAECWLEQISHLSRKEVE